MEYLPSRKFVKTIAFFLLVGAIFFVGTKVKNKIAERGEIFVGGLSAKEATSSFYTDTDADGLYDFEESLLQTNPEKADTDGDGVLDGEQYKTKKLYPEIELPPDLLQQFLDFKGRVASFNDGGQLNITNALSQEASIRYSTVGKGEQLDEKTFGALADSLAEDFSQFLPKDKYTNQNIKTAREQTVPAINAYVLSVVASLRGEDVIYKNDPLELLNGFVSGSDVDAKEKLSGLARAYDDTTKNLAGITVPNIFITTHLKLLNSSYQIAEAIKNMSDADKDPIRSILGAAAYVHNKEKKQSAIEELVSYYRTHEE